MQGTIAQIVALTTHGNSILQGAPNARRLEFQTLNSTFKFCESVQFSDRTGGLLKRKESVYATDTHNWLDRLRKEGVYALRMSYGPSKWNKIADRMLVGFVGGGGKWLIETVGPERSDFWESRWLVGNRDSADKKIWRVTYVRIATSKPSHRDDSENLERLKQEMRENLREMRSFPGPKISTGLRRRSSRGSPDWNLAGRLKVCITQTLHPSISFRYLPTNY
jgi:hypothetical protein